MHSILRFWCPIWKLIIVVMVGIFSSSSSFGGVVEAPLPSLAPSLSHSPTVLPTMFPTQSISNKPILFQPSGPTTLSLKTISTDNTGKNVIGISRTGPIVVSQNSGYSDSWIQTPLPMSTSTGQVITWNKPVISGNGLYFYATNRFESCYYVSSNPSTAWSQVYPLPPSSTALSMEAIAVDTTGTHIFISGSFTSTGSSSSSTSTSSGSGIYSSNSGQSFSLLTSMPTNCTSSIAMDSSGKNLVCLSITENIIYLSNNGGMTFTSTSYLSSSSLSSYPYVSSSSSSRPLFATSYYNMNQDIYIPIVQSSSTFSPPSAGILIATSQDNGVTFTDELISGSFLSSDSSITLSDITVSGNGQQLYLATNYGIIYSLNGGITWYRGTTYQSSSIAVSKSGANIYTQTNQGLQAYRNVTSFTLSPTMAPSTIPSSSSSSSSSLIHWTSITLPYDYYGYQLSAVSSNGTFILACGIGSNLISYAPSTEQIATAIGFPSGFTTWNSITMSSDGNHVVVIANNVPYYMYNRSMIFHPALLLNTTPSSESKQLFNTSTAIACAMNEAGNVTLIGGRYNSTTYRTPWKVAIYVQSDINPTLAPVFTIISSFPDIQTYYCSSLGVDATGMILITICESTTGYISTDQGVTWSSLGYTISSTSSMLDLSQLYHGNHVYAISSTNTNIGVSTDQGKTWSSNQISSSIQNVYSVKTSANGQVVAVATNVGYYISYTYGATWTFELSLSTDPFLHESSYISTDVTGTFFAAVQHSSSILKLGYHTVTPMPSFVPTFAPTAVPSYSMAPTKGPYIGGWVFGSYFSMNATTDVPVFYSGYRLGYCFANSSSPSNALWYEYSCSDTYIKVSSYDNAACTGTPLSSETMSNPSDNVQCTSNTTLPYIFNNGFYYSVDQYYADITYGYNASSCYFYDTVRFDAYVNDVCINDPESPFYYYAYFPYVLAFPKSVGGCYGPPSMNITFPTGCTSMMADDMVMMSKGKTSETSTISGQSDSKQGVTVNHHEVTLQQDDNQFGSLALPSVLQRFHQKVKKHNPNQQEEEEERELGLFYNYGDDYSSFEGHSFSRYPMVIDVSVDIDGNFSLSIGVIAGIVVGGLCGCCLFLGCIAFFTGGLGLLFGKNAVQDRGINPSAPVDIELTETQSTANPIFATKQAK